MLSAEQLEKRRAYICASDVAAILGVDEWNTPYTIYGEKIHGHTREPGEAAIAGNFLEGAVLDWCEWKLNKKFGKAGIYTRSVMLVSKNQFMAANVDSLGEL
jgi:predicted phage-related endonuclease